MVSTVITDIVNYANLQNNQNNKMVKFIVLKSSFLKTLVVYSCFFCAHDWLSSTVLKYCSVFTFGNYWYYWSNTFWLSYTNLSFSHKLGIGWFEALFIHNVVSVQKDQVPFVSVIWHWETNLVFVSPCLSVKHDQNVTIFLFICSFCYKFTWPRVYTLRQSNISNPLTSLFVISIMCTTKLNKWL